MIDRYRELAGKVDAFVARVGARHGDQLQCKAGCEMCCRQRLTITAIEAEVVRAHVEAMAVDEATRLGVLAARPVDAAAPRCAALDDDGRCSIYAARPLVCRSHGVPVRLGNVIDACRLNFAARGPASADADCVLDQTTLSATLLALDRAHAAATGGAAGERQDLAEVVRAALMARTIGP